MAELRVAGSELILGEPGGQAARAEALAAAWLARSAGHEAIHVAGAQAWDREMRERIAQRRRERTQDAAQLRTVEEPVALAHALGANSRPETLVVVDALTLWLTALMMRTAQQGGPDNAGSPPAGDGAATTMADAIGACAGPLVLIGQAARPGDVLPGRAARQFADTLGRLDQQAAAACERVTLVSNGLAMVLKGAA